MEPAKSSPPPRTRAPSRCRFSRRAASAACIRSRICAVSGRGGTGACAATPYASPSPSFMCASRAARRARPSVSAALSSSLRRLPVMTERWTVSRSRFFFFSFLRPLLASFLLLFFASFLSRLFFSLFSFFLSFFLSFRFRAAPLLSDDDDDESESDPEPDSSDSRGRFGPEAAAFGPSEAIAAFASLSCCSSTSRRALSSSSLR
mmetsp:Transcript_24767/g.77603  ORF Transcript_24767/g.77603 Transcript_24767/m.77603 type:complete len:205 (+) Transcript_24767:207-821(+)